MGLVEFAHMRIADMLARSRPSVSFEFMRLVTRERSTRWSERWLRWPGTRRIGCRSHTGAHWREDARARDAYQASLPHRSHGHLTCANSADRTRQILNWMEREGVANVARSARRYAGSGAALHSRRPSAHHGSDLVAFVRRNGYRFGIGAACSTEKHPESPDLEHEFRYMKLKVEAGADFLITSSSSTTGSFSTSWRVPGQPASPSRSCPG